MEPSVRAGDLVLLLAADGERHLLTLTPEGVQRVRGLGVVDPSQLVGKPWGSELRLGLKDYVVTRPRLADHAHGIERRAQIILPKDASRIIYETGLGAGDRVLEAGVGSGALTIALAHAVAPTGRLVGLDLREDHLSVARKNVERAGLGGVVELRVGDVRQKVVGGPFDAAVLDLPDPYAAVGPLRDILQHGATVVAYTPLIDQAVRFDRAARDAGFKELRTMEILERNWVLHDQGARPSFEMLGHTGFLTFGRRP